MGVPKHQATLNRQAIIDAASRAFRERGVDAVGVADLMREAGFTHGGFYNHFESKDALAAEACASAFACGAERLKQLAENDGGNRLAALRTFMEGYLSAEQCNAPGAGCPTATLAVDAARHGHKMQEAYSKGIEAFLDVLTRYFEAEAPAALCSNTTSTAHQNSEASGPAPAHSPAGQSVIGHNSGNAAPCPDARRRAITLLANLIGTMVLARGVDAINPVLSEEVLSAGRSHLAWIDTLEDG